MMTVVVVGMVPPIFRIFFGGGDIKVTCKVNEGEKMRGSCTAVSLLLLKSYGENDSNVMGKWFLWLDSLLTLGKHTHAFG